MAPPIYVKGGVWTNVEDQILKAAVSKYGLTQWARVASLLPKKTAKQAKARWNEYLNPAINRSSWSREDDEKLLSLAKLLPNQWRSISSIMGRTATHCVERYQKLLEDAARNGERSSDEEDEDTADLKLTGPGIESLPALGNAFESLPSRPDAEEMEEDEREMLSEAKARLANTQGKKAKRKDRERMLEESKRVALLQKRRELKAAGINVSLTSKNRRKRNEFDYNADIPHERQPKPGLYDVSMEEGMNEETKSRFLKEVNFKGVTPQDSNKSDAAKNRESSEKETAKIKAKTRSAAETVSSIDAAQQAKRRKLELPLPGAESEEDAINMRISEKSRDLLVAQTPSGHISLPPTEKVTRARPPKVSRKRIVSTLRTLLEKVPKPKESNQIILPKFDPHEETMILNTADESAARIDQLDLLKQVAAEKVKIRRSRVLQQGLAIPSPDAVTFRDTDSPLLAEIKKEYRALVNNDLIQEDYAYDGPTPTLLDEDLVSSIEAQVERELGDVVSKIHPDLEHSDEILPKSQEAITKTHDLLHSLHASANEADQKSGILEDTRANVEVCEKLKQHISVNASEISDVDLETNVLRKIMWNEEAEIERRSAALHEMVDDMKAAERRVSREEVI